MAVVAQESIGPVARSVKLYPRKARDLRAAYVDGVRAYYDREARNPWDLRVLTERPRAVAWIFGWEDAMRGLATRSS